MSIGASQSDSYYDAPDSEWSDAETDEINAAAQVLVRLSVEDAIDNLGMRWEDVPELTEAQFVEADERAQDILRTLIKEKP